MEKRDIHRHTPLIRFETYNSISFIYDELMSHVNYHEWHKLIKTILNKYKISDPLIFEIGGGTGILGELLDSSHLRYQGSDKSSQMCLQAKAKNLSFICADCRKLPLKTKFDLIIFLYDGINYLHSLSDYSDLFNEVYSCLVPGGLFLFDITTHRNSMTQFTDYLDYEELDRGTYIRHSYYDSVRRMQYNDFSIFLKLHDNLHRLYKEHHVQKIFSAKNISSVIPKDLFSIEGIWDNFSLKPYTKKSERIHFLLKKKS